ncbi:MAG: DUF4229 domain-containing protein [Thermocrispum sp.]
MSKPPNDRFAVDLTLYLLARFGLTAAIAAALVLLVDAPVLVAALIGLVAGFPLALLLFRGLNARVTAGLATRGDRRKAERARLRAQLRGEAPGGEQR